MSRDGPGDESHLTFFLTAIFLRSAWKYRARAYRYHLLDTGHVAENLFLALKALELPLGYHTTSRTLQRTGCWGLTIRKKWLLPSSMCLGANGSRRKYKGPIPTLPEPMLQASRVSAKEIDYPAVRECIRLACPVVSSKAGTEMIQSWA